MTQPPDVADCAGSPDHSFEDLGGDNGDGPCCLILHGLGGGIYEVAPLVDALRNDGMILAAPVLPGHEGPGPVMPASRWRDWAERAESAFRELAATGRPVIIIGFSTGATLALYLASRQPVARLVLLAPFLAIRYTSFVPLRPASVIRVLARVFPNLRRRPPAVRDREMRKWASAEDQFKTFNLHATLSALALIDEVKTLVAALKVPTLIIQGKLDTVVEPAQATWLHRNLGSSDKRLVMLARSDHLVVLDRDREQVIALTREFIQGRNDGSESAGAG